MPVDLSVKQVDDEIAERLRARAKRNHRSLQGELKAILEEAVGSRERLTVADVVARVRQLGIATPSTGTAIIREARDSRGARALEAPRKSRAGRR